MGSVFESSTGVSRQCAAPADLIKVFIWLEAQIGIQLLTIGLCLNLTTKATFLRQDLSNLTEAVLR